MSPPRSAVGLPLRVGAPVVILPVAIRPVVVLPLLRLPVIPAVPVPAGSKAGERFFPMFTADSCSLALAHGSLNLRGFGRGLNLGTHRIVLRECVQRLG